MTGILPQTFDPVLEPYIFVRNASPIFDFSPLQGCSYILSLKKDVESNNITLVSSVFSSTNELPIVMTYCFSDIEAANIVLQSVLKCMPSKHISILTFPSGQRMTVLELSLIAHQWINEIQIKI